jgi:flagellin
MAFNDISLTAGMRSNLTSLQSTVSLLNRTQERLSSGKKVNTALDNPVNFFASQALNNRAADLAGYKDGMANAVQTIKAANEGITSITTLINSAKSLASSVIGKPAASGYQTETVTLAGVALGDQITVDGSSFTAVATGASATQFNLGATDALSAMNLAQQINSSAARPKAVAASAVNGSMISLTSATTNILEADVAVSSATKFAETMVAANSERSQLVAQYNSLLTQISTIANDASFQGQNMLSVSTMTVDFGNGHSLSVSGFDASATGLALTNAQANWAADANATADTAKLDAALTTLRTQSTNLSNNLSVISARQDFSTKLGLVLTTGADNLTLADANEEGANMLMLQTRQSLSTTALSLSAQAAQSVLKLFG